MHFVITCAAGLESILKKEIEIAGYQVIGSWPTLVRFKGDLSAIAKINLRSRVWNKLFLELGQHITSDFDGLFDLVQSIDWHIYIQNNPIIVTAITKNSQLTSTPTIQSIAKKSIVKRLLGSRHCEHSEVIHAAVQIASSPEKSGSSQWQTADRLLEDEKLPPIEILIHIENNMCSVLLNTTGESLHKRGYKQATGEAPINESLAAWLLLLSWWKFSEPLYDFFCGSWTIVIEAALLAKNIAPGMAGKPWSFRAFAFQQFARYDQKLFTAELQSAKNKVMLNKEHTIIASDIDPEMIKIARENARNAGVENYIQFECKDVKEYLDTWYSLLGTLVSNPPYGLRMNTYDLEHIYHAITQVFTNHPKLHGWIITSYEKFVTDEVSWTRKKSMFFNGGERCWFYKKTLLK